MLTPNTQLDRRLWQHLQLQQTQLPRLVGVAYLLAQEATRTS